MKTPNRIDGFSGAVQLLLPALLAVAVVSAEPAPAGASAEPKTHTLFMGTDISVEVSKKLYRVKDVAGSDFIVAMNGSPKTIPMRGEKQKLSVEQSLKLSSVAASLTGLTTERAYTPGSDPRSRRQREANLVNAVISDNASLAQGQYIVGQNNFGIALNSELKDDYGKPVSGAKEAADALQARGQAYAAEAFATQTIAEAQLATDITNGAFARLKADEDMAQELFDAVEVNFAVSSAATLSSPYVIIVTRFHERGAKPNTGQNAIYAKALDPINERPRKVSILQGGFPRGFEIEDVQVHVYNRGSEIATDVAPKRVPLTREEAFLYLKIEYFSNHKGATLPATPALGRLSAEARARLTADQLREAYFVKVSNEGRPLATFADEACTRPVDPAVESVTANIRFYPALDNGKAVEGTARLVFTQLSI